MTRFEYIKEIERLLKNKMSDNELYDIMRDYAEFFEEGKKQGKTEDEVMKSLGNPSDIAKEILDEEVETKEPDNKKLTEKVAKSTKKATQKVIDVTETTISSIKEVAEEAKEKREAKEKCEVKENKAPKTPKPPKVKNEKKMNENNDWIKIFFGILCAIIVYPTVMGLILVSVVSIAGIIAGFISLGIFGLFVPSQFILVIVIFAFSGLFFSIGILLLGIYMFKGFNKEFFTSRKDSIVPQPIIIKENQTQEVVNDKVSLEKEEVQKND